MPSLAILDEGQGNCTELGSAVKNPPAYRERHGLKDNAVNWGDPPPHGIFFLGTRKEALYKSRRRNEPSVGRESEGLIVPKNLRTT
ncbi:hypothetical protein P40081_17375 [Paenibacillus sp. FSL P4-0081]|nr:hypothetical protein P40081_00050 [Paenibacillus sp. FSL P4-0081]AIQ29729.1 hypothetical protein P40081_17375 [Paenibacillus sp. FSL P4-0081]